MTKENVHYYYLTVSKLLSDLQENESNWNEKHKIISIGTEGTNYLHKKVFRYHLFYSIVHV